MSEGISYRQILNESDNFHSPKKKALKKMLSGRSQKEQMRFRRQNMEYQEKFKRAWND